jgi:hypothetical protein
MHYSQMASVNYNRLANGWMDLEWIYSLTEVSSYLVLRGFLLGTDHEAHVDQHKMAAVIIAIPC